MVHAPVFPSRPWVPTKDEDVLEFLNGQTGESIGKFPINKFFRIRRSRLRACLVQGLDIQFSKTATDIHYSTHSCPPGTPRVTISFSDGTSQSGRIVIGTDGAKSTVRRLLLDGPGVPLRTLSLCPPTRPLRRNLRTDALLTRPRPLFPPPLRGRLTSGRQIRLVRHARRRRPNRLLFLEFLHLHLLAMPRVLNGREQILE